MFDSHATEQAVLGGIVFHEGFFTKHSDKLCRELFDDWKHRIIFDVAAELVSDGQPPDITTVAERLGKKRLDEIGGAFYLLGCQDQGVRLSVAENHVERLVKHARRREVERAVLAAHDSLDRDAPVEDVIENLLAQLSTAHDHQAEEDRVVNLASTSDAVLQAISDQEQSKDGRTSESGVSTGFRDIDAVTAGFKPGQLWVVAAYPAQGKSAWSLASAAHVAEKEPVLYFSLEMSSKELIRRLLTMHGKVEGQRIDHASKDSPLTPLEWQSLADAKEWVDSLDGKLNIEETTAASIASISSAVERWNLKAQSGHHAPARLVVVDYLQLMDLRGETIESSVSNATKMFKRLAMRWTNRGMPLTVLLLSQLVKPLQQDVKQGIPPRPNPRDLRGSGQIHADADVVAFIYRIAPFLKIQGREYDPSLDYVSEYIVAKQRNGPQGIVNLRFDGDYSLFSSLH